MKRCLLAAVVVLLTVPAAFSQTLSPPSYRVADGQVLVAAELHDLPPKFIQEIKDGLMKEIELHLELMRVWESWMDEFVSGATIVRTIKYDVIKKEYFLTSVEGPYLYEKKTASRDEALKWLTTIRETPVARLQDVSRGTYYVLARMESRRLHMPALLKVVLFFVPEVELTARAESGRFPLNK